MSNKKVSTKITLGMLKGKSTNVSVPSIAVRFNANAEEIEELYQSEDETTEPAKSTDQESSPYKFLPKLGKRSASIDNAGASSQHDSSPTSDPWRFFAGIKGKITKNIEETITEIKHRNQEGETNVKKPIEIKDNRSDSEEISESSISKTCGAASTTEGVEMSTDEDTPSLNKDTTFPTDSDALSPGSSRLKQRRRIKILQKDNKESLVPLNAIAKLMELNSSVILRKEDTVESGIEALEDAAFLDESSSDQNTSENRHKINQDDLLKDLARSINNLEVDLGGNAIVAKPVEGVDLEQFYEEKEPRSYFAPEGFVDLREKGKKREGFLRSYRRLALAICFIAIYIICPVPIYLSGFIAGSLFTASLITVYVFFFGKNFTSPGEILSPLANFILTVPEIKEHLPICTFEGWMNEFPDVYDPLTYHISQTQSVYVKLQGNLLRLSHTRAKIPKRAMWNEPKHKHTFTQHRIYNLLGAQIALLPEGLHKKRHWSKKYPIRIILSKDQFNFDHSDSTINYSLSDDSKEQAKTNEPSNKNSKKEYIRKMFSKKLPAQPQIYSKLVEENADEESPTELNTAELKTMGVKLNENLLDEDDYLSQFGPEEEHLDEEVVSVDDWTSYTPLDSPNETQLYLFGRTGREKEDWYRRLTLATHKGTERVETDPDASELEDKVSDTVLTAKDSEAIYLQYMSRFIKKSQTEPVKDLEQFRASSMLWINAIIGRLIYDWSKDVGFNTSIKEKIQKKLQTIKLPYFIEQLGLSELSLGDTSPLIHTISKPVLDQRGLWIDLDMSYEGNIVLIMQTKLNLMKLKDPPAVNEDFAIPSAKWQSSDVEDTAESSTDDGRTSPKALDDVGQPFVGVGGSSTKSKRLLRMVDRITESKFFQAATDNRYIKKAMEEVSNTGLSLKVELKGLIGTFVLNVPPPPSDRVWLGFRPTPKLFLSAQPIVGVRNMSFIRYLTNWIEKKLCKEFQKLLVIPNMEDFTIPNMTSELPK